MFDPWQFLSPKRRQILEDGWPGFFRRHILDELPVNKLAPLFPSDLGRPTKEFHTVLGALTLQQSHDLTDQETCEQLAFNLQWHYALDLYEESDEAEYICPKTLWTMRILATELGIATDLLDAVTLKLAQLFDVDTRLQRQDSVHIRSNMARLGRIGIFVKDQLNVHDDGTIEVKAPKQISSDSLQNPSDPDATYSGHKGQGCQVQIMETYIEHEGDRKDPCQSERLSVSGQRPNGQMSGRPRTGFAKEEKGPIHSRFSNRSMRKMPVGIRLCGVKKKVKFYYLCYTERNLRIARRRQYEQTEEFREKYRTRICAKRGLILCPDFLRGCQTWRRES